MLTRDAVEKQVVQGAYCLSSQVFLCCKCAFGQRTGGRGGGGVGLGG